MHSQTHYKYTQRKGIKSHEFGRLCIIENMPWGRWISWISNFRHQPRAVTLHIFTTHAVSYPLTLWLLHQRECCSLRAQGRRCTAPGVNSRLWSSFLLIFIAVCRDLQLGPNFSRPSSSRVSQQSVCLMLGGQQHLVICMEQAFHSKR